MDAILTHATEPRGGRLCQCAMCNSVDRCTPSSDFFTFGESDKLENGQPLLCSACFFRKVGVHMAGGES